LGGSSGMLIIYVVAFIAIFYFMAIRPQQRQRRAHQALLSALKKGDRIVTAAGIYGTVKRVEEKVVVVEVAKGVTLKIARRAVAEIIRDTADARATAPEGTGRRGRGAPAEIEESTGDEADDGAADEGESAPPADEAKDDTSTRASSGTRRKGGA
jgi:preprotein translocase subunit YajC